MNAQRNSRRLGAADRRRVLFIGGVLCGLLAVGGASPAIAQPDAGSGVEAASVHARSFDAAWRLVRDTHFDEDLNGVDWDAVYDELAPRAREAESIDEVRGIITDMLSRLGQSHFALIPSEVADVLPGEDEARADEAGEDDADDGHAGGDGEEGETDAGDAAAENESYGGGDDWLGLEVRVLEGELVVTRVEPGTPADEAGIRAGWVIDRIGHREMRERIASIDEADLEGASTEIVAWQIASALLSGKPGSCARLTLLDGEGEERRVTLDRVATPGQMAKFGNLPPMNSRLEWEWLDSGGLGLSPDARIGLIRFNIFMMPMAPAFERAVYELREADGIIIDLRGNLGGIGALAMAMSGRIMPEKGSLGTFQMRGVELQFNVTPQRVTSWGEATEPFAGPVAIITDGVSASTSEVMAGGLQSLGRARVFGARTAGMALPAAMDRLPNGDVLLHAIADFHTSTGQRLEKTGVIPDEPVATTREDLLRGVDAPVRAAAAWIANDGND